MKVLLSAYACEPNRGSEPGVGWQWANRMARLHDVTVVTRSNNRNAIEKALEELNYEKKPKFIYLDLPCFFIYMKKLRLLPVSLYYFLWQIYVRGKLNSKLIDYNIIHHLTFCSPLCPGFWSKNGTKRVIGPVGAPLVNAHYYSIFGIEVFFQRLRGFVMRHLIWLPWLRSAFYGASAVIPANSETKALLESMKVRCEPVILDTGAPRNEIIIYDLKPHSITCNFIYAGVLERRKGIELILRAFAKYLNNSSNMLKKPSHLILLGHGPDRDRLQRLVKKLRIHDHVFFRGKVTQQQVHEEFNHADVFVFASVRDTSGGVNLEAMAAGLPILCIAHQGVGDITDDSCAYRVQPASIDETINALSAGMSFFANHPEERIKMGKAARKRAVENFSWDAKIQTMAAIYESVIKTPRSSDS